MTPACIPTHFHLFQAKDGGAKGSSSQFLEMEENSFFPCESARRGGEGLVCGCCLITKT